MSNSPYLTTDEAKLDQVIQHAESFLESQLTTAIAADQRALTFAGLLVAAIAAIIGAVASMDPAEAVLKPLLLIGALLFIAAASALWSARPTPWQLPGSEPEHWLDDIQVIKDPMIVCKADMAQNYQGMIDENKARVQQAKVAMQVSMGVTAFTLLFSLIWLAIRVVCGP